MCCRVKRGGWITPIAKPEINGTEIAPLGISLVAYLILAGVLVLWAFYDRQKQRELAGKDALLKVSMLSIPVLRSGLSVFMSQYFVIAALFFVIPVYLQTILGLDALQTGIKLLPLSIGLILLSAIGSKLSATKSARTIVRYGQVAMAFGSLLMLGSIDPELNSKLFWIGMFTVGVGFGLLASQLGNINMSAVDKSDTGEVGGLQGTFQNLGTSFGTALVGSIFMLALTSGFVGAIQTSNTLSETTKTEIVAQAETGVGVVSKDAAEQYVLDAGGSQATATTVSDIYQAEQINALKQGVFVVFALALLSILLSRSLPSKVAK